MESTDAKTAKKPKTEKRFLITTTSKKQNKNAKNLSKTDTARTG